MIFNMDDVVLLGESQIFLNHQNNSVGMFGMHFIS